MRRRIALLTALAAMVASCGDESAPTSIERSLLVGETFVKTAGDDQLGIPGAQLPAVLRFEVRSGGPTGPVIPGARGTIVVSSGGGSVSVATFKTNAAGSAAFRWTVGTTGAQSVLVTLNGGGASTMFTARLIPPGAQLRAVLGNLQSGPPGDTLPVDVRVRLVDAAGNSITGAAGVPIRWTALSQGGGGTRFTVGRLINAGTSTNRWQLGWGARTQKLVAKIVGVDSVIFTATANTTGYTLQIYNGNDQTGPANTLLPTPLSVRVRNGTGTAIEGAKGTFFVTSGGGSLSRTSLLTNSLGRATTNWTLGTSGVQQVTATVPLIGSVTFNATIAAPVSNYNIEIRYITTPTAAQQAAVNAAVARWRQVIVGDVPDINMVGAPAGCDEPAINSVVDDIVIFVDFALIDGAGGILGSAGPCWYRGTSILPISGSLRLDAADLASMEADGSMQDVIIHEIGHILGIGTLWNANPPNFLDFVSTDSVRFNGPLATTAFNSSGGSLFAGPKVPVENCVGIPGCGGGTINAHWRELVMGRELMTGYLSGTTRPLSLITVQSLADFGYTVNTAAADAYTVGAALRATPEPAGRHLNEAPRPYAPRPFPQ